MLISHTPETTPDFSTRGAGVDWKQHNVGVTPQFFVDKQKRKGNDGTETEVEIECVSLRVAGDTLTEACQPVDDQIRERFAAPYAAWKEGKESLNGTPVVEWKSISARQAIFLEANNIFTVEDLAALSDGNIHNVDGGRELRDKAQRWLKTQAAESKDEKIARYEARLAALEKQLEVKKKRRQMSQEQRDQVAATQRARHEAAKRGLAALKALEEAAIVAGENSAQAGENSPPVV